MDFRRHMCPTLSIVVSKLPIDRAMADCNRAGFLIYSALPLRTRKWARTRWMPLRLKT